MRPGANKVDFSEEVGEGGAEIGKGASTGETEYIHVGAGLLEIEKTNTKNLN